MYQALRLAISLCLCQALFAQVQNQARPSNQTPAGTTQPALAQPQSPPPATTPKGFILEDATPLKLRINRTISSAGAHVGDTIDFEVPEEVLVTAR